MAENPRTIRWGIMGTGTIASDFTQVLLALPHTEVAAVGSRTAEGAARFGDRFGIRTRHASYEALAADGSLDIVYVATPSLRHVDDCLLCLRSGRHVLCEKSMAPCAADARRVLEEARARRRFFLHGVWSRFFRHGARSPTSFVARRAPRRGASARVTRPPLPAPRAAPRRRRFGSSPPRVRAGQAAVIDSGAIGAVVSAHASFAQADGAGACGGADGHLLRWLCSGPGGRAPLAVAASRARATRRPASTRTSRAAPPRAARGGVGVGTFECSLRHPSPRGIICGTAGVIRVSA